MRHSLSETESYLRAGILDYQGGHRHLLRVTPLRVPRPPYVNLDFLYEFDSRAEALTSPIPFADITGPSFNLYDRRKYSSLQKALLGEGHPCLRLSTPTEYVVLPTPSEFPRRPFWHAQLLLHLRLAHNLTGNRMRELEPAEFERRLNSFDPAPYTRSEVLQSLTLFGLVNGTRVRPVGCVPHPYGLLSTPRASDDELKQAAYDVQDQVVYPDYSPPPVDSRWLFAGFVRSNYWFYDFVNRKSRNFNSIADAVYACSEAGAKGFRPVLWPDGDDISVPDMEFGQRQTDWGKLRWNDPLRTSVKERSWFSGMRKSELYRFKFPMSADDDDTVIKA